MRKSVRNIVAVLQGHQWRMIKGHAELKNKVPRGCKNYQLIGPLLVVMLLTCAHALMDDDVQSRYILLVKLSLRFSILSSFTTAMGSPVRHL